MHINIIVADYSKKEHALIIPLLLDSYASDPMGGGEPLSNETKENLSKKLSEIPNAFSIIAYVDNNPAGLVNCFESFSTFLCKPLINIHDVVVLKEHRGKGICSKMLKKVEEIAKSRGCCKLTLEVLSNNDIAKTAYKNFGFSPYQLDEDKGQAEFWQKSLN